MANYFEFFGIPISFSLDEQDLKRRFYANSKKYHPDFYTLESPDKQAEILHLSSLNNEAYQTLSDFDSRMKYILGLKGLLKEEGQNEIPQDFLLDMMDINESLIELEFDYDPDAHQRIEQQLKSLEDNLFSEIKSIMEAYDDQRATETDLKTIKDYFLKKRYLLRIRENLSKFASR